MIILRSICTYIYLINISSQLLHSELHNSKSNAIYLYNKHVLDRLVILLHNCQLYSHFLLLKEFQMHWIKIMEKLVQINFNKFSNRLWKYYRPFSRLLQQSGLKRYKKISAETNVVLQISNHNVNKLLQRCTEILDSNNYNLFHYKIMSKHSYIGIIWWNFAH